MAIYNKDFRVKHGLYVGTNIDASRGGVSSLSAQIGSGYGDTGLTISSLGDLSANGIGHFDGNIITNGGISVGGGYGNTGITISSAGSLSADGVIAAACYTGVGSDLTTNFTISAGGDIDAVTANVTALNSTFSLPMELKNTGVSAGSYGSTSEIPTFTVDEDGRLTAAGSASISTSLGVSGDSGSGTVALGSQSLTISGTSNEIETSVSGQTVTIGLPDDITIAGSLSAETLSGNGSALTSNFAISAGGDVDSVSANITSLNGTFNLPLELKNTGVAAGSYGGTDAIPTFAVDEDGRLTSAGTVPVSSISSSLQFAGDSGSESIDLGSETMTFAGTTDEIETSVSGNTVTVGLPDDVKIAGDLTVGPTGCGYICNGNTWAMQVSHGNVKFHGPVTLNCEWINNKYGCRIIDFRTGPSFRINCSNFVLGTGTGGSNACISLNSVNNRLIRMIGSAEGCACVNSVLIKDDFHVGRDTFLNGDLSATGALSAASYTGDGSALTSNFTISAGGDVDSVSANITSLDSTFSLPLELKNTGVAAGSYGSTDAIPTFAVDEDGRLTSAGTVPVSSISSSLEFAGDSGSESIDLGEETLTFAGTTNEIETSVSGNTVTIGLPDDVTVGGGLLVSGDTIGNDTATDVITLSGTSVVAKGSIVSETGVYANAGGQTIFNHSNCYNACDTRFHGNLKTNGYLETGTGEIYNGTIKTISFTSNDTEIEGDLTLGSNVLRNSSGCNNIVLDNDSKDVCVTGRLFVYGDAILGTCGHVMSFEDDRDVKITCGLRATYLKNTSGTTAITVGGTQAGPVVGIQDDLVVGGDITLCEGSSIGHRYMLGTSLITCSDVISMSANDVKIKGDLVVGGREIKNNCGVTVLSYTNSNSEPDVNISNDLFVSGEVSAASSITASSYNGDGSALTSNFTISAGGDVDNVTTNVTSLDSTFSLPLELKDTGVSSGTYGSTDAIPTFTVDDDGRLTSAGTVPVSSISSTLAVSGDSGSDSINLGSETLAFAGTTDEIETSVSGNTVTVGLPDDVKLTCSLTVGPVGCGRICNGNNWAMQLSNASAEFNGPVKFNGTIRLNCERILNRYGCQVLTFTQGSEMTVCRNSLILRPTSGSNTCIALSNGSNGLIKMLGTAEGCACTRSVLITCDLHVGRDTFINGDLSATGALSAASYTGDGSVLTSNFTISAGGDVDSVTANVTSLDGTFSLPLELKNTAVSAGSYGSTDAIPTFTVDEDGRLTSAGTVPVSSISASLEFAGDSGTESIDLGSETMTFAGTSNEIETSVSGNTVTIGLPDDVTIGGDLTVTGNDIKDSSGSAAISFDGSQNVTAQGNLTVNGNNILDSGGQSAISFDGSRNVTAQGNLTVAGNLVVSGDTVTQDVSALVVEDPVIKLAKGNSADSVDIGFYGQYRVGAGTNDSDNRYAGLIRDTSLASSSAAFVFFADSTTDLLSGNSTTNAAPAVEQYADVYVGRLGIGTNASLSSYAVTISGSVSGDSDLSIGGDIDGSGDLTVGGRAYISTRDTNTSSNNVAVFNSDEIEQRSINPIVWDTGASLLSGSGTENFLSKWGSNGSELTNSTVFDAGSGIGIGTSQPESGKALTIVGDTSASGNVDIDGNTLVNGDSTFCGTILHRYGNVLFCGNEVYNNAPTKFGCNTVFLASGNHIFCTNSYGTNYVKFCACTIFPGQARFGNDVCFRTFDGGAALFVDASENSIGIGTTQPSERLDVVGNARVSNDIILDDQTAYSSASAAVGQATEVAVATFCGNEFRSGKVLVQSALGTSQYEIAELLLIHDGTDVHMTQYGSITTEDEFLTTYSANYDSSTDVVTICACNSSTTNDAVVTTSVQRFLS